MDFPSDVASAIKNELKRAKNILIMSHRSPDADTVGSNLALRIFAGKKNVTSACVDDIKEADLFLPGTGLFVKDFDPSTYDLFIAVDCGSVSQAHFPQKYPQMLDGKTPFINIDHHPSNDNYGTINLVMTDTASTTMILYKLFKTLDWQITPDVATCLLAGLYFDTGSFMHSNTGSEVYEAAGNLMALGAEKDLIINDMFKRQTVEKLHLLGKILTETRLTDKKIAISAIRKDDLADCHAGLNDISGAIDLLNCIKGSRFAALLSEDGDGNIRGSLRTRNEDVNMSEIAGTLGGGGHRKASGFSVKGKLEKEVRWVIKPDK